MQTTQDLVTLPQLRLIRQNQLRCKKLPFYIVLSQQLWPYFSTSVRLADPQDPGNNSSYDNGKSQTHNNTIRDVWQLKRKNYKEFKHMN